MKRLPILMTLSLLVSSCGNSKTPEQKLFRAIKEQDLQLVQQLIDEGVDVNAKSPIGGPDSTGFLDGPLSATVVNGNYDTAAFLILAGADVNAQDLSGSAPLHRAAFFGRTDLVILLIENGAKVNIRNSILDSTPLHSAVQEGHVDAVEALLKAGASALAKDEEGKTPIYYATKNPQALTRVQLGLEPIPENNTKRIIQLLEQSVEN